MRLFPSTGYLLCTICGAAIGLAVFKGMDLIFPLTAIDEAIINDIKTFTGIPIKSNNPAVGIFSFIIHLLFASIGALTGWYSFRLCLKLRNLLLRE